jgi:hypothetical protein
LIVRRPRYSLAALLLVVAGVAVALKIYQNLNPPPVYPLPIFGGSTTFFSYAFGFTYSVEVSEQTIDRAPLWDRRSQNPPLSVNEAMVRAERFRQRLLREGKLLDNVSSDGGWYLEGAELTPFDPERGHWYWLVRYQYGMSQTGPPHELRLVVLMDGTVVETNVIRPKDLAVPAQGQTRNQE